MALDPAFQLLAESRQVKEEVFSLTKLDRRSAASLVGVDQVDRVELVAAVVALVSARGVETADRALAFDVAVRQRPPADWIERAHLRLRDEVALLVELEKQVLGDAIVVARRRPREDVVGHPQPPEILDDQRIVLVDELARRHAALVGLVCDGGAVLVRAARHQHARPAKTLEAREHVSGHGEAGHMTDVARAVGVGPCRRDQYGTS